MLLKLRNPGNNQHNCQVLRQKTGDLVVFHRPTENVEYNSFVPCIYCYAYLSKSSLWKHACPLLPVADGGNGWKRKRVHKSGASLLPSNAHGELSFVLLSMRRDGVGEVTIKDAFILQYGHHLVRKFGNDKEQYGYIRGKMRQLGLLICLRKQGKKTAPLREFVHPSMFQMVVDAAQQCAGFDEVNHTYDMSL